MTIRPCKSLPRSRICMVIGMFSPHPVLPFTAVRALCIPSHTGLSPRGQNNLVQGTARRIVTGFCFGAHPQGDSIKSLVELPEEAQRSRRTLHALRHTVHTSQNLSLTQTKENTHGS
ncbi:MAG TPA: hypothetical protein VG893_00965 [Terracidiphilus sp.]|nr:hypothetical protein [Terracidiphilus sp.]